MVLNGTLRCEASSIILYYYIILLSWVVNTIDGVSTSLASKCVTRKPNYPIIIINHLEMNTNQRIRELDLIGYIQCYLESNIFRNHKGGQSTLIFSITVSHSLQAFLNLKSFIWCKVSNEIGLELCPRKFSSALRMQYLTSLLSKAHSNENLKIKHDWFQ